MEIAVGKFANAWEETALKLMLVNFPDLFMEAFLRLKKSIAHLTEIKSIAFLLVTSIKL